MSDNPNVILRNPDGSAREVALESTLVAVGDALVAALGAVLTELLAKTEPADAQRVVVDAPTPVAEAYDIQATTIYVGRAPLGAATSAAVWTVRRTLLVAGNPTGTRQSSTLVAWDDRALASYV